MRSRTFVVSFTLMAGLAVALAAQAPVAEPQALTADALFDTTRVWTVQLTVSPEGWAKLTPPLLPPGTAQAAQQQATPPSREIPAVLPPDLLKRVVGGFLGPEGGRNGLAAQRGVEFEYVHASFELDGYRFADIAVRAKGNGSYVPVARFPKPSLKLDLNKYVKGQKLAGVSTINLHNNITDASWMNEVLAFRFYRDAGIPAPRTAYAKVYLTVTGGDARRYLGLYSLVENVDDDFTTSRFGVDGGALLKPVTLVPFLYLGDDWVDYNQMYDPKTDLTTAETQRIIEFCRVLSTSTDDVFAARAGEFIDLDAFARYMAALVWMANPDSVLQQGQNYYVHMHPTTGKLAFLPWDQDHSFGQYVPFLPTEQQQQLDILHPWTNRFVGAPFAAQLENRLVTRTLALESFRRRYLNELATIARTVGQVDRIAAQVDELGALLGPVVAEEPKDGRVMAFQESLADTGTYRRPINQNVVVVPIKVFVKARQASVLAQLDAHGVH